jgi:hypothetical protein
MWQRYAFKSSVHVHASELPVKSHHNNYDQGCICCAQAMQAVATS